MIRATVVPLIATALGINKKFIRDNAQHSDI